MLRAFYDASKRHHILFLSSDQEYKELQSRGFHVSFIIPDYEYVSVKHLMTGDSNIVKWGIDHEG